MIHSKKFLSSEAALYFYKSAIQPSTEYCCHVLAGARSCFLDMLDKLQKQISLLDLHLLPVLNP